MDVGINTVLTYIFPLFIVLMIIEYFLARHLFDIKESFAGFAVAAGASLIAFFTKIVALGVFIIFFDLFKLVLVRLVIRHRC